MLGCTVNLSNLFTNDPCYPRAHPEDSLYQKSCVGYMDTRPKDAVQLAEGFLHAVGAQQGRRDSIVRSYFMSA